MCIRSEFKEMFLKLTLNGQSDKAFLLTSKLCLQGVVYPCHEAIHMWKNIKNMYTIRFETDFFLNLQQMVKVIRPFCWHQTFDPKGLSTPAPRLYICGKNIKKYVYNQI